MAEYADREHYIPLRKSDLIDMLCKDSRLDYREHQPFRQFCKLVAAVWHFEYLANLDALKDAYAPFDPDSTTRPLKPIAPEDRPAKMDKLFEQFVEMMERANFRRMSRKDIDDAVEGGASDWGVNMYVDFDVFERLELFSRGDGPITRTKKHTILFWKKEEKKVDAYRRLVILVKLRKHKRVPETVDVKGVFVKMFKDIPKLDLEMVLPGTSLQMPLAQRYKLGGSLLGTLGYGIYQVFAGLMAGLAQLLTFTWETASAASGLLWGPFVLLGGYAYKQYSGYQVTKQTYSKMLTESLYYQSLDNNLGVITQIMDEVEEQECRETILAYYYLWKHAPAEGWSSAQLDDYVEMELEGKLNLKVDFEVDDALAKLEKLEIVTRQGDKYQAVALDKALERLDYRWDHYFEYNQA
jgi:Protein of unknown function (DUF3754)